MAELENLSTKLTGCFLESLCVDWFTDVSHFFLFRKVTVYFGNQRPFGLVCDWRVETGSCGLGS